MKYRKTFMFMIRLTIGFLIVACLWIPVDSFFRVLLLQRHGLPYAHDLGDGYEIWTGGRIHYRIFHEDKYDEIQTPLKTEVTKWVRSDPWLIGFTDDDAWFVIDKKNHVVNYPVHSEQEIKTITGLDVSNLSFVTETINPPSPSYIPYTRDAEKYIKHVKRNLFYIPLVLGILPNVWQLLCFLSKRIKSIFVSTIN